MSINVLLTVANKLSTDSSCIKEYGVHNLPTKLTDVDICREVFSAVQCATGE